MGPWECVYGTWVSVLRCVLCVSFLLTPLRNLSILLFFFVSFNLTLQIVGEYTIKRNLLQRWWTSKTSLWFYCVRSLFTGLQSWQKSPGRDILFWLNVTTSYSLVLGLLEAPYELSSDVSFIIILPLLLLLIRQETSWYFTHSK